MNISIRKKWVTAAVSEAGASHLKSGVPCQDACRVVVGRKTIIACVADGAGSARHSGEGSRVAVDAYVEAASCLLERGYDPKRVVCLAFQEARSAVADKGGGKVREYATTLLALVATRNRVAAAQIGDGAVVIDGRVALKSHRGVHANETSFITQERVVPYIYTARRRIKRVALMTDGMERLALQFKGETRQAHKPFFDPMYRWLRKAEEGKRLEQLSEFLSSDMVQSRTDDDVTLLLAMR